MSTTEDGSGGTGGRLQQAPGLWRTDLQQQDLSAPGREVVQSRVTSARKRHWSGTRIRAKRSSASPPCTATLIRPAQ
jgi:hypothetical protein